MNKLMLIGIATAISTTTLAIATAGGGGTNFDKLTDADRKVFQERFTSEIWPLLQEGKKNGCLGCHSGGVVSSLKFTGKPEKDFTKLLRDGFFIPDDSGSLLTRITTKNRKQMMPPPGKGDRWSDANIQKLQKFVADLDKKQQK